MTSEFKEHWAPLTACTIGIGLGAALTPYTMSIFSPELIRTFGWSKAQFALVGSLPILTLALAPIAGRFTDLVGPRVAAAVGFSAIPLGFIGFSLMRGSLLEFCLIWLLQTAFGILTTSLVFARVIVERFNRSRGLALSALMTGPPLAGALLVPVLAGLIAAYGWRGGYVALAAISGFAGAITIMMMGKGPAVPRERRTFPPRERGDLLILLRNRGLLLLIGGMFLVNLPQVVASSQLKLLLLEDGVDDTGATMMVSLYAIGVIVGRFLTGLALDRLPTHMVGLMMLGLPTLGFLILSASVPSTFVLGVAILTIGLAQGAEGDIGAYLIAARWGMQNYSFLMGFVSAAIGAGTAAGSILLSGALFVGGSYTPFLILSAVASAAGALLVFLTGFSPVTAENGAILRR